MLKRNFVAESRIEPIIVMIDASRLSKSLATALKDREHGIPVQPNHSLPLRPAPLLPIRKSSTICMENLTTSCPNIIPVLSSDREENDDGDELEEKNEKKKKKKKKKKKRETVIRELSEINHRENDERNEITNRAFIGINFYDSVPKENDSNEVDRGNVIHGVSKNLTKIRATKSLDGKERGESKHDEKRRKSYGHRTTGYVSSDINKRRKISDSDNNDKVKSENRANDDKVLSQNEERTEFLAKKRKSTNDDDDISSIEKGAKILKTVETKYKKNVFPDILRYRVTDKKISQAVESSDKIMRDKIKITSSITLKEILHKPYYLPKCPEAVPIEIAHKINRNDLLKSDRYIIQNINCDTDLLTKKFKETDNRLFETNSDIGKEINKEIGFTNLPSMPILEDGKTDPLSGMLTPPKELVNGEEEEEEEEEENCQSNLIGEAASMLEAEIEKAKGEVNRVNDFDVQESIDRMKKLEKENEDNLSNLSRVFEIKIPGRSPELIFLNNVKNLPSEKLSDMADDSLAEAAIPESLPVSVEPAFDERIKTDDDKNVESLNKLVKFSISLRKNDSEEKLLKSFESSSDDNERRKKAAENVVRQKIKRLNRKLEKFIKEENDLKSELSRTIDAQKITELNPKINCARKRKENIEKHLDKLKSKEKSSLEMKSGTVPRIQVRKDLIESIPPTILKSEKPSSISSPGIRSINETDERSIIKSPPIVITISESDSSFSSSSEAEEEKTVETEVNDGESRLEEISVEPKTERTSNTVIVENLSPSVPENIENRVFEIPESVVRFNEIEQNITIVSKEDNEQRSTIISKESGQIVVGNLLTESMNKEKTNLTEKFETSVIAETEPSKSHDPIVPSINEKTPTLLEKTNFQNAQLTVPSFNVCNCRRCPGSVERQAKSIVAPLSSEINILSTTSSDPKIRSGTFIEDNRNVYPVQNYPKDYRTSGNFSRDNGGANSDLSSPLQGHSALPLPPPIYGQNLTAQGYPLPQLPAPENHQTKQLHIKLPTGKSASTVNLGSKQEERLRSPIRAAHLLTAQGGQEVPANLSVGKEITNLLTNSKEIPKGNFEYGVTSRIMTEQFPTLGNWLAEQISRKPVVVGAVPNFNTTLNQSAGYKPLGSDMYKMTATAVDIAHPPPSETVPSMWRPNPDQQIVASPPGASDEQKNKPNSYYRRDNNQFVNPQNNHHLPNYQRTLYNMKNGGYSGQEMPAMPYPIHPNRQNFHMTNNVNVNGYPGISVGQQKVWQYQPATSGIWIRNNNNNGNPTGVMPQQQHHLQQLQQMVAPTSSSSSLSSLLSSSYVKMQPTIGKNLNKNHGNSRVIVNGRKKKQSFDNSIRYNNPQREIVGVAPASVYQERGNANLLSPNPTVIHGGPTYIAVLQNQRGDNVRTSSSGSINFDFVYPNQVSAVAQPTNHSKCLRCSRPAPKFNCADCEVAFYCNEYCQESHWMTHSIECRKKMPKLKKVS